MIRRVGVFRLFLRWGRPFAENAQVEVEYGIDVEVDVEVETDVELEV